MRLDFRQGIVQYQLPTFLVVGGTTVSINVVDTPTILTFADGPHDYLFTEINSVNNAWTGILPSVDQWLYWDLDQFSAKRTFGITLFDPVVQNIAPPPGSLTRPVDQHWFDTSTNTMKVWNGVTWIEKLRVFACKLANGTVPVSVSINSPSSFAGTQAGLSGPSFAGEILFDQTSGNPYRTPDGYFLTSESPLTTHNATTSSIKTAAMQLQAIALQSMSGYTVVKFSDFGKILPADEYTSQNQQFGIIEASAAASSTVYVVVSGVITNPNWNWPTVNARLYSDSTGTLTLSQPVPNAVPVATVVDVQTIIVGAPQVVISGGGGGGSVTPATNTNLGIIKVSVPAVSPSSPIAVGDNDPRIVNALNKTGDTMTGFLSLNADPTNPLHAATKQYVDSVAGGGSLSFPLHGPDGSVSAPSYSFTTSTNTGLSLDSTTSPSSLVLGVNGVTLASFGTGTTLRNQNDYVKVTNGQFSVAGDAQSLVTVLRTITTTATPTTLLLDGPSGSTGLVMPNNSTWRFDVYAVARRTDASGEHAAIKLSGAISRNASAVSTALIGSTTKSIDVRTSSLWDVNASADIVNGALQIQVTGENAKTIRWVIYLTITQVSA